MSFSKEKTHKFKKDFDFNFINLTRLRKNYLLRDKLTRKVSYPTKLTLENF